MSDQPEDIAVIAVRRETWETLSQTLELDARSAACDPDLRTSIRKALDSVVDCDGTLHVTLMILSGIVDEVKVFFDEQTAEAVLIGWLRGQPGIPDDLTIDQWWQMRESETAPMDLEDSTIYEVPLNVTWPEGVTP